MWKEKNCFIIRKITKIIRGVFGFVHKSSNCGFIFSVTVSSHFALVMVLWLMFPLEYLLNMTFQSTKIAYAAYDCSWYTLSAREARLLMTIMCRARSPLYITAGRFCSFNRELYSEVWNHKTSQSNRFYFFSSLNQ